MDRNEYLLMCRECAMLERGRYGNPISCPDELRVVWDGMEFWPCSYRIDFEVGTGRPLHVAIFRDLRADSIAGAPLEQVERKAGGKANG